MTLLSFPLRPVVVLFLLLKRVLICIQTTYFIFSLVNQLPANYVTYRIHVIAKLKIFLAVTVHHSIIGQALAHCVCVTEQAFIQKLCFTIVKCISYVIITNTPHNKYSSQYTCTCLTLNLWNISIHMLIRKMP